MLAAFSQKMHGNLLYAWDSHGLWPNRAKFWPHIRLLMQCHTLLHTVYMQCRAVIRVHNILISAYGHSIPACLFVHMRHFDPTVSMWATEQGLFYFSRIASLHPVAKWNLCQAKYTYILYFIWDRRPQVQWISLVQESNTLLPLLQELQVCCGCQCLIATSTAASTGAHAVAVWANAKRMQRMPWKRRTKRPPTS